MPATEPAVPIQVESDALKQMMHVEQSETAARKYLDLVVQAFHKGTGVALNEVVGNQIQPGVQQAQEVVKTPQPARFHLAPPPFHLPYPLGFGAGRVEDGRERLAQIIGLLQCRRQLKELGQTVTLVPLQIGFALAKGPHGVFELLGLLLRQFLAQPLELLFPQCVSTITIVGRDVVAVDHNARFRQQLLDGADEGLPHIGTDSADLTSDVLWHRLEPGDEGGFGAIRQNREHDQAPALQACGHNGDVIAMSFLERDFVNPQSCEWRQRVPIDGGRNPARKRAENGLVAGIFLLADIFDRAVDELHQQMVLVGRGMQGFGLVPTQPLGRGGMVVTIGAAKAFGADTDVDHIAQDREMAQLEGLIVGVEVADRAPAAPAHSGGQGAFDLDDQFLLLSQFGAEHPHIREVKRDGDRGLFRHQFPFCVAAGECGGLSHGPVNQAIPLNVRATTANLREPQVLRNQ